MLFFESTNDGQLSVAQPSRHRAPQFQHSHCKNICLGRQSLGILQLIEIGRNRGALVSALVHSNGSFGYGIAQVHRAGCISFVGYLSL